jgi:poly(3-hydroxybutyrate) depolymerase
VAGVAALAALATAFLLPGFTALAPGPDGGQVLTGTFPGGERPGFVYLPPRFDPALRYPVVYLLHGMRGSPDEYLGGTDLAGFADAAIADGRLRPFIAVIPAAGSNRDYNGEWAGPWEHALLRTVGWADAHLPTIPTRRGRVLAGLSAGGYGAVDIGLRHPGLFGAIESWSGYFRPLHDGPFAHASRAMLAANDPAQLVVSEEPLLARLGMRFFVSSGPAHSHWFQPSESIDFTHELQHLGLPSTLRLYSDRKGEWRAQLDAGLAWALPPAA